MTSPSSMTSAPSGGAKLGGCCGCPPELQVQRLPSGVGCSLRCLLLRASSSVASWVPSRVVFRSTNGGRQMLELALLSKMIQRGSESNVNKVSIRDGKSSVNLASQGHCARVFIGI
jgi:hypothetical protein